MTASEAIAALDIPAAAHVERRVPKTLLVEHGAPTAADRRRINEGIENIVWVAALKPGTVGVAAHRDEFREYLEIAIIRMTLRLDNRVPRLIDLLHRAVPYPVLAVTELQSGLILSLAHKRWSQAAAGKTVLEGEPVSVQAPGDREAHGPAFAAALALSRQPRASLLTVYEGWVDTFLALEAARRTGRFEVFATAERQNARREALQQCARLEAEVMRLRAAAAREKQLARQVELNLELRRAEAACATVLARL